MVGRITSVFGVRGWVKVYSYTDPMDNILTYRHWRLSGQGQSMEVRVAEGRRHGPGIIVRLDGVSDRDEARQYCDKDIRIPVDELPELGDGEYYWHQLVELDVRTVDSVLLGRVVRLMETGANDVLVIRPNKGSLDSRERLIPWNPDEVIRSVDLENGELIVDWDPEF
ncbi:16S rRNA processing protein RimM [Tamilnaduibacter salinus]|uniref:Ribosome maturation factor RimM n=1 Tax=Tamilnaduibacter salinus TaxID=1484056 RepID=A0A2U1D0Q8_9GAMM|nr:16S rRNA processing protein RimM [Tamilnaduibacter salinus]